METPLEIAALYVALHLILLMVASMNVGSGRMKNKINLGDGGNEDMIRKIRAQGNYIEYAPFALIGLVVLAMLNAPLLLLHILGTVFFIARVLYFLDMGRGMTVTQGRMIGTLTTMLTLLATAISIIWISLF